MVSTLDDGALSLRERVSRKRIEETVRRAEAARLLLRSGETPMLAGVPVERAEPEPDPAEAPLVIGRGPVPCEQCGVALPGVFFPLEPFTRQHGAVCFGCLGLTVTTTVESAALHERGTWAVGIEEVRISAREFERVTILVLEEGGDLPDVWRMLREINALRCAGKVVWI